MESCIFVNDGNGHFTKKDLSSEAQLFPVWAIQVFDFNKDGFEDLLLSGNLFETEPETPRLNAGYGLLMLNDQQGSFDPLSPNESGLYLKGDLRDIGIINDNKFLFSRNNETVLGLNAKEYLKQKKRSNQE